MDVLQVERITSAEFIATIRDEMKTVAAQISPDMKIGLRQAAAIAQKDESTIHRWLKSGTLTNVAEGNEPSKVSLYQLITILNKKKK
jgi:hypothetical protein